MATFGGGGAFRAGGSAAARNVSPVVEQRSNPLDHLIGAFKDALSLGGALPRGVGEIAGAVIGDAAEALDTGLFFMGDRGFLEDRDTSDSVLDDLSDRSRIIGSIVRPTVESVGRTVGQLPATLNPGVWAAKIKGDDELAGRMADRANPFDDILDAVGLSTAANAVRRDMHDRWVKNDSLLFPLVEDIGNMALIGGTLSRAASVGARATGSSRLANVAETGKLIRTGSTTESAKLTLGDQFSPTGAKLAQASRPYRQASRGAVSQARKRGLRLPDTGAEAMKQAASRLREAAAAVDPDRMIDAQVKDRLYRAMARAVDPEVREVRASLNEHQALWRRVQAEVTDALDKDTAVEQFRVRATRLSGLTEEQRVTLATRLGMDEIPRNPRNLGDVELLALIDAADELGVPLRTDAGRAMEVLGFDPYDIQKSIVRLQLYERINGYADSPLSEMVRGVAEMGPYAYTLGKARKMLWDMAEDPAHPDFTHETMKSTFSIDGADLTLDRVRALEQALPADLPDGAKAALDEMLESYRKFQGDIERVRADIDLLPEERGSRLDDEGKPLPGDAPTRFGAPASSAEWNRRLLNKEKQLQAAQANYEAQSKRVDAKGGSDLLVQRESASSPRANVYQDAMGFINEALKEGRNLNPAALDDIVNNLELLFEQGRALDAGLNTKTPKGVAKAEARMIREIKDLQRMIKVKQAQAAVPKSVVQANNYLKREAKQRISDVFDNPDVTAVEVWNALVVESLWNGSGRYLDPVSQRPTKHSYTLPPKDSVQRQRARDLVDSVAGMVDSIDLDDGDFVGSISSIDFEQILRRLGDLAESNGTKPEYDRNWYSARKHLGDIREAEQAYAVNPENPTARAELNRVLGEASLALSDMKQAFVVGDERIAQWADTYNVGKEFDHQQFELDAQSEIYEQYIQRILPDIERILPADKLSELVEFTAKGKPRVNRSTTEAFENLRGRLVAEAPFEVREMVAAAIDDAEKFWRQGLNEWMESSYKVIEQRQVIDSWVDSVRNPRVDPPSPETNEIIAGLDAEFERALTATREHLDMGDNPSEFARYASMDDVETLADYSAANVIYSVEYPPGFEDAMRALDERLPSFNVEDGIHGAFDTLEDAAEGHRLMDMGDADFDLLIDSEKIANDFPVEARPLVHTLFEDLKRQLREGKRVHEDAYNRRLEQETNAEVLGTELDNASREAEIAAFTASLDAEFPGETPTLRTEAEVRGDIPKRNVTGADRDAAIASKIKSVRIAQESYRSARNRHLDVTLGKVEREARALLNSRQRYAERVAKAAAARDEVLAAYAASSAAVPRAGRTLVTMANTVFEQVAPLLREMDDPQATLLADHLDSAPKNLQGLLNLQIDMPDGTKRGLGVTYVQDQFDAIEQQLRAQKAPLGGTNNPVQSTAPGFTKRQGVSDLPQEQRIMPLVQQQVRSTVNAVFQKQWLDSFADQWTFSPDELSAHLGLKVSDTGSIDAAGVKQLTRAGYVRYEPDSIFTTFKLQRGGGASENSMWVKQEIAEAMTRMIRKEPGLIDDLFTATYDHLIAGWRGSVLNLRPQWQINNAIGGFAMVTFAGKVSVKDYFRFMGTAFDMARRGLDNVIDNEMRIIKSTPGATIRAARGRTRNSDIKARLDLSDNQVFHITDSLERSLITGELATLPRNLSYSGKLAGKLRDPKIERLRDAGQRGVVGGAAEVAGRAIDRVKLTSAQGARMNSLVDDMNRVLVMLAKSFDEVTGDFDVKTGVAEANRVMGDYSKLSEFERRVVRRAFPFYTWTRHITGVLAKHLTDMDEIDRTLLFTHVLTVIGEPNEEESLLPEWTDEAIFKGYNDLGIPMFYSPRGADPFSDAVSLFASSSNPALSAVRQTGPFLGGAFHLATGIDPLTEKPTSGVQRADGSTPRPGLGQLLSEAFPQVRLGRDFLREQSGESLVRLGDDTPFDVAPGSSQDFMSEFMRYMGYPSTRPLDVRRMQEQEERRLSRSQGDAESAEERASGNVWQQFRSILG